MSKVKWNLSATKLAKQLQTTPQAIRVRQATSGSFWGLVPQSVDGKPPRYPSDSYERLLQHGRELLLTDSRRMLKRLPTPVRLAMLELIKTMESTPPDQPAKKSANGEALAKRPKPKVHPRAAVSAE